MRTTFILSSVAAGALLGACSSENELRYTATLQAETHGVVLSDDGLDGFAAMSGTTCTIDVNWGCPTADEDLPTEQESLVDHFGHETLGVSSEGVHAIVDGRWDQAADIAVQGVRTARLKREGGHVVLGGSPEDCWIQHDGDDRVGVPGEACDDLAHTTIDRATGTMFVASDGRLLALERDGARELPQPGNLVAWDATVGLLYTAEKGSTDLWALEPSGELAWEAVTRDPIADIGARGERGEVMVLTKRSDGLGGMERRTGETGRLLGHSVLPTADGQITSSLNGVRIAVIRGDEVHFFALETDGEAPVVDETPPECIDPLDRASRD